MPSAASEHVLDRDPGLVLSRRRELRADRDVARGPDPLDGRALSVIDDDVAAIGLDARALRRELLRVRHPPGGEQNASDAHLSAAVERRDRRVALAGERLDGRIEHDLDALGLECGVQLVRCFGIGARRDLRVAVHDRHARTEAGEDLCELEADRAAADDEQRLGYLLELERGDVVDPIDLVDARNARAPPCASRRR